MVIIWHCHSYIELCFVALYSTGVAPPNLEVSSVTDEIVAVPKVTGHSKQDPYPPPPPTHTEEIFAIQREGEGNFYNKCHKFV